MMRVGIQVVLAAVCFGGDGILLAAPPVPSGAADARTGPIAELDALGIPVEYGRIRGSQQTTCPEEIESITLGNMTQKSDLPQEALAVLPQFPNLRRIRLQRASFDPRWLDLLTDCPRLEHLYIHSSDSFKVADDLGFLQGLSALGYCGITNCGVTDQMLDKLLPLRSVRHLDLRWNRITEAGLPTLMKLPSLEELSLAYNRIGGSIVDVQRHAAELKVLSFMFNPVHRSEVDLDELRELAALPRHTWNVAYNTDVPVADIAQLLPGPIRSIETVQTWSDEVRFSGVDDAGQRYRFHIARGLDDADLADIGKLENVRHLKIARNVHNRRPLDITDDGLQHLGGLHQLETLTIHTGHRLAEHSLNALLTMPELKAVSLVGIDLDDGGLRWLRSTPKLSQLSLADGRLAGSALADLAQAGAVGELNFTNVAIAPPTRPIAIDNVARLKVESPKLSVDECRVIAGFRSLESLTIHAPVTDAHLAQLAPLEQLTWLSIGFPDRASRTNVTPAGIQQLRRVKSPLYVQGLGGTHEGEMADQFGWRFYGCSSGCCDTLPVSGLQLTAEDIEGDRPKRIPPGDDPWTPAVIRLRGPMDLQRLVLRRQDLPQGITGVFLTDCRIGEIRFEGWMPATIRLWGSCRIERLVATGVPDGASTAWTYKFLEGERELVVPASPYLTNLAVEDCDRLESLKLIGFYPQLSEISLRNVGRLRYLGAPYSGDAPQLNFPSGRTSIGELAKLRLLKLPGTGVTDAALGDDVELPPSLVEVDLRGTRAGDQWLGRLAKLPALTTVRIGECANMSPRAKDEFRRSRPDVELDEHTLHRPHDSSHPPVHPDACP